MTVAEAEDGGSHENRNDDARGGRRARGRSRWAGFQAGVEAYNRGDYATALKEWRPLAEQGDASAQHNLGWMYHLGQGVPQDDVQARMWLNLAAAQGNELARINRDRLTQQMTPVQLAEAQRLAREWRPKE